MDVEHTVDSWLRDLPEFAPQPRRGGKRKRQIDEQDQHLASPPVSENKAAYDEMTRSDETPKKRRLGRPGADDVEATPRPNQAVGSSISLSEAASSSSVSRASSASSPKRQRLALRLHDAGIKMNVLDVDQPPKELEQVADLIGSIQDAGRAVHILPHAMEAVLGEQLRMRKLDFRKWRYAFQTSDDHVPTLPGRLPSLDEVQRIQREAAECQRHEHEEFSWNSQVHLRLLEAVFKDANGPCDSFGFTSWYVPVLLAQPPQINLSFVSLPLFLSSSC